MSKAEKLATLIDLYQQKLDPQHLKKAAAHLRALEASHQRLEEALEKIATSSGDEDGCYYTNRANIKTARAALEQAKDLS